MKKLELKHKAFYLPYKLQIRDIAYPSTFTMTGTNIGIVDGEYNKPIFRPISSITNVEIEQIGYDEETLEEMIIYKTIPLDILHQLLKLHIDIFELIPLDLAIVEKENLNYIG